MYDRSLFLLVQKSQSVVFLTRSTRLYVLLVVILASSVSVSCFSNSIVAFGDKNKITLTLDKSSFTPMSTVHGNQLSVSVKYQVNDKPLAKEKINGLMKIYSPNGTLMHSTSFPQGFNVKSKGGVEELKTTIRDPSINQVLANLTFTDLKKTQTLSNTVTAKLELNQSSNQTIQ